MRRNRCLLLLCLMLSFLQSCGSEPGIDARYKLEKQIWDARMIERKIWQHTFATDYRDVEAAIAAYRAILEWDSLQSGQRESWSPRVRLEIRERVLTCKVALVKLYFLQFQDDAGVTYFRSGLERHDLMFLDYPNLRLQRVKRLYASLPADTAGLECARLVREIKDDPALWLGHVQISDTLLSIPLYLARTEVENNPPDERGYAGMADEFYSHVIRVWPDSLAAYRAKLKRADLNVLLARYDDALLNIESAMSTHWAEPSRDALELFAAEIRAHGLKQYDGSEPVFRRLIAQSPRRDVVDTAKLNLAIVQLRKSDTEKGIGLLRDVQLDKDVPPETATIAMFVRAMHLRDAGTWPDALSVLWRICRLYPFTRASLIAPLVIVRQYVSGDDMEKARRAQGQATEFYLSAIKKDSASIRYRHLLKDYLIESYLIVGDPLGAAVILENDAPEWKGENGAVGMLKSALIYLKLLDDRENGVRMLKKCLDLFPHTRYSKIIQGQIATLSNQPSAE
ncbi:MAG: hypothetical protein P8181_05815 [bacterium]